MAKKKTLAVDDDEIQLLTDAVDAYADTVKEDVEEFGERPPSDLKAFERLSKKVWKLDPRATNLARKLSQ